MRIRSRWVGACVIFTCNSAPLLPPFSLRDETTTNRHASRMRDVTSLSSARVRAFPKVIRRPIFALLFARPSARFAMSKIDAGRGARARNSIRDIENKNEEQRMRVCLGQGAATGNAVRRFLTSVRWSIMPSGVRRDMREARFRSPGGHSISARDKFNRIGRVSREIAAAREIALVRLTFFSLYSWRCL